MINDDQMLAAGFWILAMVLLCGIASIGMRIENWIQRRRERAHFRRIVNTDAD